MHHILLLPVSPLYHHAVYRTKKKYDIVINSLLPREKNVSVMLINLGSGNGLLPDGIKPLPQPALPYHHYEEQHFVIKFNLFPFWCTQVEGAHQINSLAPRRCGNKLKS